MQKCAQHMSRCSLGSRMLDSGTSTWSDKLTDVLVCYKHWPERRRVIGFHRFYRLGIFTIHPKSQNSSELFTCLHCLSRIFVFVLNKLHWTSCSMHTPREFKCTESKNHPWFVCVKMYEQLINRGMCVLVRWRGWHLKQRCRIAALKQARSAPLFSCRTRPRAHQHLIRSFVPNGSIQTRISLWAADLWSPVEGGAVHGVHSPKFRSVDRILSFRSQSTQKAQNWCWNGVLCVCELCVSVQCLLLILRPPID